MNANEDSMVDLYQRSEVEVYTVILSLIRLVLIL